MHDVMVFFPDVVEHPFFYVQHFFGVGNHQTADIKVYSLIFAVQRNVDGWKQQRMKLKICSHRINGTIVYLPTFRTYKSTQPLRVR